MPAREGPPAGRVCFVVDTAAADPFDLRDVLYSVVAQTYTHVSVALMVDGAGTRSPADVEALPGRLAGLLEVRATASLDRLLEEGDAGWLAFPGADALFLPRFAEYLVAALGDDGASTAATGHTVVAIGRATEGGFVAGRRFDLPPPVGSAPAGAFIARAVDVRACGLRLDGVGRRAASRALLDELCRRGRLARVAVPLSERRLLDGQPEAELAAALDGLAARVRELEGEVARSAGDRQLLAAVQAELEAISRSRALRLARAIRRTGLHRPLRAAFDRIRPDGRA
jgi:hypothetical protein